MAKKTQPQSTIKKTTERIRTVAPAPPESRSSARARSDNGIDNGTHRGPHNGTHAFPHELVALRAYQIYLERGGGHGRDMEDWLQAEREVPS